MKEKVALLEAEIRNRDEQLSALQERGSTDSETRSSAPDLETAKGGYLKFVEGLRSKFAEAMPTTKFDRTSVFPVEGPDPSKPIFSRVAFRIVSTDGRTGEMVVPLFADPAGNWQEPSTEEIVSNFKTKLAPPVTAVRATTSPPPEKPTGRPTDVMGANRTVDVDWNDSPKQGKTNTKAPTDPQPPPQQPPQQPDSLMPKKVMPTSRDVIIDFE